MIGKRELSEPKEQEAHFGKRISSLVHSVEDGYTINPQVDPEKLKSVIVSDIEYVTIFFDTIRCTGDLAELMIQQNGLRKYEELFAYLSLTDKEKMQRYIKQLYNRFGQESRWNIFEKKLDAVLLKHGSSRKIIDLVK